LTAGGIHKAIEIGNMAGSWVHDYLNDEALRPDKVMKKNTPSYNFKSLMRRSMNSLQPNDRLIDSLFESKFFRSFAQTIFFHHRGLLSVRAWKDLWGMMRMKENY
jgi:flavin-dependent dehydrogenase